MDKNVFVVLVVAISILIPSAILSIASYSSILALGRNPSGAAKIFTGMVIALAIGEAFAVGVMSYMLYAYGR